MAKFPTKSSAQDARRCLAGRGRKDRPRKRPGPKCPLRRCGRSLSRRSPWTLVANVRQCHQGGIFAAALTGQPPFQTLQRLQDAAKLGICSVKEDHMRTIGHFIGGREVKGTSGRFADVFEPMTGDVQAKVALASKAELRSAVENA